nr:hypothetical protein GCM10020092_010720 [Actinoplanes digitatis]
MSEFAAVDVIRAKRDGLTLSDAQIDWVVDAYTKGVVADEQMSALAMAILLRGMTAAEIARWTAAMIASGERLDLSAVSRPTVDKHSTGGVGDKITLPLTPLVAACGAAVPQLSGRGLGHTGGTLDKLESVPGWRATLSNDEFVRQLQGVGAVICAAGDGLAPADRKLYALRDVTGTVEAIPLIASSIMSKKIAEGTGALVLDVKVGTGAFMKDVGMARELARTMVELGGAHGVRTVALLTDMNTPLGLAVGNAIEVEESLEVLAGGGPRGRGRADARPGPGDACRGRPGRRPGEGPGVRRRDGLVEGDDPRTGRRPGRAAAHRPGDRGAARGRRRRYREHRRAGHRPGRLAARRLAGPARRIRSASARASCSRSGPATPSAPATRCSNSVPMTGQGSPPRARRPTARSG